MSEIIFGTPEHVAGLSRKALEEDFQWVNDRRMELEGECERLDADNAKLRELCAGLLTGYECGYGELCKGCTWDGLGDSKTFSCLPRAKARELGVEVDG